MVPFRFSFGGLVVLAGSVVFLMATATEAQPMAGRSPYPGPARAALDSYSPLWEGPSPIIMTSINYPGLYGSYFAGVPALVYNTRPSAGNFYTAGATDVLPPRLVTLAEPAPAAVPPGGEKAHVNVMLPSEATLTIQGVRMSSTGSFREFVSPPLPFNQDFTYTISASWTFNGRDVTQERVVRVRAGERVDVDLMTSAPRQAETSTLRAQPLP
jgi:uncharacterized protein (TIGR03000 family)